MFYVGTINQQLFLPLPVNLGILPFKLARNIFGQNNCTPSVHMVTVSVVFYGQLIVRTITI